MAAARSWWRFRAQKILAYANGLTAKDAEDHAKCKKKSGKGASKFHRGCCEHN